MQMNRRNTDNIGPCL